MPSTLPPTLVKYIAILWLVLYEHPWSVPYKTEVISKKVEKGTKQTLHLGLGMSCCLFLTVLSLSVPTEVLRRIWMQSCHGTVCHRITNALILLQTAKRGSHRLFHSPLLMYTVYLHKVVRGWKLAWSTQKTSTSHGEFNRELGMCLLHPAKKVHGLKGVFPKIIVNV